MDRAFYELVAQRDQFFGDFAILTAALTRYLIALSCCIDVEGNGPVHRGKIADFFDPELIKIRRKCFSVLVTSSRNFSGRRTLAVASVEARAAFTSFPYYPLS